MKQVYLTATLFFCLTQFSFGQVYSQYFDGADNSVFSSLLIELDTANQNCWQIGIPQKTIFNSPATQPKAMVTDTLNNYPVSDTSRFIAKILMGFGNHGIFSLQWKQKLDFDKGIDGGIVEYSVNNGSTWVNAFNNPYVYNFYGFQPDNKDTLVGGEYAFSGTDASWKDIWLCFDMSWLQQFDFGDTLMFRFTMLSDAVNTNKEGWMIDNMLGHISLVHTTKVAVREGYLKVFPNPATNIVNIEAQKIMDFHIIEEMELIDPLGQVVDKWTNVPTKFWFKTDVYKSGLYFLKIKTNVKSDTVPLVIDKN